MIIKMPRKYKEIKLIRKDNYNSNTMKGILVISPLVLNLDLNVNKKEWEQNNKNKLKSWICVMEMRRGNKKIK